MMRCVECNGHLVALSRLERIKGSTEKSTDDLKNEASSDFKGDTIAQVKCPSCHFPMEKQQIAVPVLRLYSDYCNGCSLMWLDGGELALLQLGYQVSNKFLNAQELKLRMKAFESDPERKARYEQCMKRMPSGGGDLVGKVFGEADGSLLLQLLQVLISNKCE